MRKMDLKILLLAVTFLVCCSAAPTLTDEDRRQYLSILINVLKSEKKQSVVQELHKGYVLNHPNDAAIDVSEEKELLNLEVNPELCLPSGECFDPDDPGVYPQKNSEELDTE